MTRVALVPSAYLPHLGGVEELTRHLALALVAAGDEVEVWTQKSDDGAGPGALGNGQRAKPVRPRPAANLPGEPAPTREEILDDLRVRRFPFPLPRRDPRSFPHVTRSAASTMGALRRAVASFRPDVLHVQCFGPNGAYATALSWMTGVPLVVTLQGETVMDDQDIFETSTALRSALRLGLRRAAAVTACSRFSLADAERRFGLTPGRGMVIWNGVGADRQPAPSTTRPRGFPPPPRRYVLALGRVVDKKGFDLLIRAFGQVFRRHPDVDLVIGGTGPAEARLRDLVEQLQLAGRVHLPGRLSREEVAAAMDQAEVFVMPSRLEPFGIVVLEAWRAGRATVATCRGGPLEYVRDGEDGLLADPVDTPALAQAIDRVLSDSDLRMRLGLAARHRVAEFDWRVIAEQYRDCYWEIAGRRARGGPSRESLALPPTGAKS